MDTHEGKPDLGRVKVYIVSPTRALLIRDRRFSDALCKLSGGHIESGDHTKSDDDGVIATAIREVREETGVELFPEEVELVWNEFGLDGIHYDPYFCVARVTEEKLDTREEIGNENGSPIETVIVNRAEILTMPDLLEDHRPFIRKIEGY